MLRVNGTAAIEKPYVRQSKTVLDPRIPLCEFRIIFLVSGAWIPGSSCMLVGSGFLELNYGFQSPEFRISPAKLSRIPESGLPRAVVVRKSSPKGTFNSLRALFAFTFDVAFFALSALLNLSIIWSRNWVLHSCNSNWGRYLCKIWEVANKVYCGQCESGFPSLL